MAEPDAFTQVQAEVLAANRRFYEAFENRDLDAMSDAWENNDTVSCVHPGWPRIQGWGRVAASWFALFQGPQAFQFILTNESVRVEGDVGWVACDENLLDGEGTATVTALNVFCRSARGWLMVSHHGSAVAPNASPTVEEGDA